MLANTWARRSVAEQAKGGFVTRQALPVLSLLLLLSIAIPAAADFSGPFSPQPWKLVESSSTANNFFDLDIGGFNAGELDGTIAQLFSASASSKLIEAAHSWHWPISASFPDDDWPFNGQLTGLQFEVTPLVENDLIDQRVPEPGSFVLLCAGLAGITLRRKTRR